MTFDVTDSLYYSDELPYFERCFCALVSKLIVLDDKSLSLVSSYEDRLFGYILALFAAKIIDFKTYDLLCEFLQSLSCSEALPVSSFF